LSVLIVIINIVFSDDEDIDDEGNLVDPAVWLCRSCLIGRTVPVRNAENKWKFGVVVSGDPESPKCQVHFDENDTTELVEVEAAPYTKYLDHWKQQAALARTAQEVTEEELNVEPLSLDFSLSFEDTNVSSLAHSFENIFEVRISKLAFALLILGTPS
jgi:hypothetical protein